MTEKSSAGIVQGEIERRLKGDPLDSGVPTEHADAWKTATRLHRRQIEMRGEELVALIHDLVEANPGITTVPLYEKAAEAHPDLNASKAGNLLRALARISHTHRKAPVSGGC